MASAPPNNLLVDVRTPTEFYTGALSNDLHNATNIEYQSIASLPAVYRALGTEVSKTDNITLYCRSGRRSKIALQTLRELGYVNVRDIGGLEAARAVLKREEQISRRADEVQRLSKGKDPGIEETRKKAFGTLLDGLRGCK